MSRDKCTAISEISALLRRADRLLDDIEDDEAQSCAISPAKASELYGASMIAQGYAAVLVDKLRGWGDLATIAGLLLEEIQILSGRLGDLKDAATQRPAGAPREPADL